MKRSLRRIEVILLLFVCVVYFLGTILTSISQVTPEKTSLPNHDTPQPIEFKLDLLEIINIVGTSPLDHLPSSAWNSSNSEVSGFLEKLSTRKTAFLLSSKAWRRQRERVTTRRAVHIATAACEERGVEEGVAMLKSALLFGQHADIHAYLFTDPKSFVGLALNLLELKWTSEVLGNNFHFTIVRKHFPTGWDENFYLPCATQRLFLPTALPDVDAVLYVDSDTLFVSNLTQIWEIFDEMNDTALAAAAPNTEGPPNERVYITPDIPIYGNRGINAGVMLMNLTRMRDFGMEERAIAVEMLYKGKLLLADQDIYNIIFHISPDKLHAIGCSYNFYYAYCTGDDLCISIHQCFCDSSLKTGVKIVHGSVKSFHFNGQAWSVFMSALYNTIRAINLLTDNPLLAFEELATNFRSLDRPCSNLTAEAFYMNALQYLQYDR